MTQPCGAVLRTIRARPGGHYYVRSFEAPAVKVTVSGEKADAAIVLAVSIGANRSSSPGQRYGGSQCSKPSNRQRDSALASRFGSWNRAQDPPRVVDEGEVRRRG